MQIVWAIVGELISGLGGMFSGLLGSIVDIFNKGANAAKMFHQEGISAARDLGLSLNQSQAYTQSLVQNTINLADKYGVAAEAIKEIQRGISEATNRQLLLNEAETEGFVQLNKLVGAQTTNAFTAEIMNTMGGQVSTVQGAISKAYATAAREGLNAKKFSGEVAKNLSLANKLSFKDGINGIIKMTALSQKLGFNLQTIEAAAGKFMELDSAIETSARMTMLGGAAGAYGSNPLEMMYEANYNPEAFTERMTNTLGGYAQFDAKSGMSRINGMNMDFVREIGKAMGIGAEEAVKIAKKQAEVQFKESKFSGALNARFGGDEAKKNYLLNNSTYNTQTGQLELNGKNINSLSNAEIDGMMRLGEMSDHDLVAQQAQTLISIDEQMKGSADANAAAMAKGLVPHMQDIQKAIGRFSNIVKPFVETWGRDIGAAVGDMIKTIKANAPQITSVLTTILTWVTKFISFCAEHWKLTLIALAAWKLLGNPIGRAVGDAVGKRMFRTGGNFAKQGWNGVKTGAQGLKNYGSYVKGNYQALRSGGNSMLSSAKNAFKGPRVLSNGAIQNSVTGKFMGNVASNAGKSMAAKSVMTGAKLVKGGGIGIVGALGNMATDALVDNGKIERGGAAHYGLKMASTAAEYGALGSMIGSVIPGVGTAVGAVAGAAIGSVKGAYDAWKSLPENADKGFFDFAGETISNVFGWFTEKGNWVADAILGIFAPFTLVIKYWDEIGEFVGKAWDKAMSVLTDVFGWFSEKGNWVADAIMGIFAPFTLVIKYWDDIGGWVKSAWDGAVSAVSSIFDWFTEKGNWVADAIMGIFAPFTLVIKYWDEIGSFVKDAWDGAVGAVSGIFDWFTEKGNWVGDAILGIFAPFTLVIKYWDEIVGFVRDTWDGAMGVVQSVFGWFTEKGNWVADAIMGIFAPFTLVIKYWDDIGGWIQSAWDGAVSAVSGIFDWFTEKGNWVADAIMGVFAPFTLVIKYWDDIGTYVQNAWDGAVSAVSSIFDWFTEKGNWVGDAILGVFAPFTLVIKYWDEIGAFVKNTWNKATGFIINNWKRAISTVTSVFNWFTEKGNWVADAIMGIFTPFTLVGKYWDELGNYVQNAWDSAIGKVKSVFSWFTEKGNWVADAILNVFAPFTAVIKYWDDIGKWFKNVWDKVVSGFNKFIDNPFGTIKEGAKGIWSTIKSAVFSTGGIVGGNSTEGDQVIARVNSREMILNQQQQAALFNFINNAPSMFSKIGASGNVNYYSATDGMRNIVQGYATVFSSVGSVISKVLNPFSPITTKPFGEDSFKPIPKDNGNGNNNGGDVNVSVNDINVNISGTIKLDSGNSIKNIDVRQLLNDASFISSLKDMIKESINRDMNGGRLNNDLAYMRGKVSSNALGY